MGARTQYRSGSSRRLNVFSSWHFVTLLSLAGWPRKVGLLRRKVVNSQVADTLAKGLLDAGMAIGAFDIRLACALVAQLFDRQEWEPDFDEILRSKYVKGRDQLLNYGETVPMSLIESSEFQSILAFDFVAAVWHGVRNPEDVTHTLNELAAQNRQWARRAIEAGMDIDPAHLPESAEAYFDLAKGHIEAYEEARGPIPDAPVLLVELAESVRGDH